MSPSPSHESFIERNLRFNLTVNLLDGGFFGMALGFASFITIIPLFVSQMTDSALLIGLVPAIHNVGWQFPQLLTADWVSRSKRIKPLLLWTTVQERLPFLGLAAVAWFLPRIGTKSALALTFALLVWQGFGGGLAANAWTSLISKIIPLRLHGTFFGAQAAAFTALEGLAAIVSGLLLDRLDGPLDFTLCFLVASAALTVSFVFLALTREAEGTTHPAYGNSGQFWQESRRILRSNANFVSFLALRSLSQFAAVAFSFYTVYVVWTFSVTEAEAGYLTAAYLFCSIASSLVMGRLADRKNPRVVMAAGGLAASASAAIALAAPSAGWFYVSFLLASVAIVAIWTIPLPLTVRFGSEQERPYYIGLSSTLTAPATILAPLLGGWLADTVGFQATFVVSILCGVLMAGMLVFVVKDPQPKTAGTSATAIQPAGDR